MMDKKQLEELIESSILLEQNVAELYRDMGQHDTARDMIGELRARWLPLETLGRGETLLTLPETAFDLVGSPANGFPFQPVNGD